MLPELKITLQSLINIGKGLLTAENSEIFDYQGLHALIVTMELREEITKLNNLIDADPDDFIDAFKELCRDRAARNTNTCLSFTAFPEGVCNQLYLDITHALFPSVTMANLFNLLLPEVSVCVTPMVIMESVKLSTKHLLIQFSEEPLSKLSETFTSNRLQDFVVAGSFLFDVEEIAGFDFTLHYSHYLEITKAYPELACQLYRHNNSLKNLAAQLQMVSGKGLSPKQVIKAFIIELLQGGSKFTGNYIASISAQLAFTNFMEWVETIPNEHRKIILELNANRRGSLAEVISHLRNENCVEIAADQLTAIINNPDNQAVLNAHPLVSDVWFDCVRKQYRRGTCLATASQPDSVELPGYYIEQALSKIKVHNDQTCLMLLLSFPTDFFAPLLQQIHPHVNWRTFITIGIFSQKQLLAIYETTLVLNQPLVSFQIRNLIIQFAISNTHTGLLQVLFPTIYAHIASLDPEIRFYELTSHKLLSHVIMNHPDFLKDILLLLSNDNHNTIMIEWGWLLETAKKFPKSLVAMVESLAEENRLKMLTNYIVNKQTFLLHRLTYYPKSFQGIFPLLPPSDLIEAGDLKDGFGRTLLHHAAKQIESLTLLMSLYSREELQVAASQTDIYGCTVLHLAAANNLPDSLVCLLQLYPERARYAILTRQDNRGKTVLDHASNKPLVMAVILALLPTDIAKVQQIINRLKTNSFHLFALFSSKNNLKKARQIELALKKSLLEGTENILDDPELQSVMKSQGIIYPDSQNSVIP